MKMKCEKREWQRNSKNYSVNAGSEMARFKSRHGDVHGKVYE